MILGVYCSSKKRYIHITSPSPKAT